ncbi:MAG: nucleotide exchange factor GrpE [Cyanobacteria bacterium P01_H01_bin.15]
MSEQSAVQMNDLPIEETRSEFLSDDPETRESQQDNHPDIVVEDSSSEENLGDGWTDTELTSELDPPSDEGGQQDEGPVTELESVFPDVEPAVPESAQVATLKAQLEDQTKTAESFRAQYLRLAADFENFRRRTQNEQEETEVKAKCSTLTEVLSVVDNFERARSQIKPTNDSEMAIHRSYQGVYKSLVDSLKRIGVTAMRPEGEQFDPLYHEAMLRQPSNEHAEGTVLEQLVRGYLFGDRVLRHAMVTVAAGPEPADDEDSSVGEETQSDSPASSSES